MPERLKMEHVFSAEWLGPVGKLTQATGLAITESMELLVLRRTRRRGLCSLELLANESNSDLKSLGLPVVWASPSALRGYSTGTRPKL